MYVPGRIVRVEDERRDIARAEMKDTRLVVVDPDDGMIVGGQGRSPVIGRTPNTTPSWAGVDIAQ
jgi:hypothetical protein